MQWFRTDTFKEATKRATVVGRDFYLAEKQQPRPQAIDDKQGEMELSGKGAN